MWFLCSTCHSSFTKRANLKRHIKSVHLNVRFICDVCKSEFKRKEYLTRHMRSAHPTPSDRNQPQHQENCTPSTSNWDPTTDFNLDNFIIPPTVEFIHEIQPEPQSVFSTDICKQKTASSQTDRSKPPKKLSVKHQHSSTYFTCPVQRQGSPGETHHDLHWYISSCQDAGLLCYSFG